eukprot:TRINITY_DN49701_c0_g1_i1.p1 TRINITY_DN49701_c0_g1~~TRINITY_DN49701_c0_g1_i1.p1  ORF type:complete len:553 (+),score=145.45 TRINITY_DN49701_c0_g1_i1:195-1661(+)
MDEFSISNEAILPDVAQEAIATIAADDKAQRVSEADAPTEVDASAAFKELGGDFLSDDGDQELEAEEHEREVKEAAAAAKAAKASAPPSVKTVVATRTAPPTNTTNVSMVDKSEVAELRDELTEQHKAFLQERQRVDEMERNMKTLQDKLREAERSENEIRPQMGLMEHRLQDEVRKEQLLQTKLKRIREVLADDSTVASVVSDIPERKDTPQLVAGTGPAVHPMIPAKVLPVVEEVTPATLAAVVEPANIRKSPTETQEHLTRHVANKSTIKVSRHLHVAATASPQRNVLQHSPPARTATHNSTLAIVSSPRGDTRARDVAVVAAPKMIVDSAISNPAPSNVAPTSQRAARALLRGSGNGKANHKEAARSVKPSHVVISAPESVDILTTVAPMTKFVRGAAESARVAADSTASGDISDTADNAEFAKIEAQLQAEDKRIDDLDTDVDNASSGAASVATNIGKEQSDEDVLGAVAGNDTELQAILAES